MPREKKLYRNPPFVETDVLEGEEVRRGLRVSERHWYRIAPSFPVSRFCGEGTPRYIWGEILKVLARTGAAAKAS